MNKIAKNMILGAALAGFFTGSAQAAETINISVIDGYPARAMWVKEFSAFFIPEVDKRLAAAGGNYEIKWQESYGGTIVKPKGVLEGIKLGLGDIGIVTTIFHNAKLPSQALSAVTPFVCADARVVAKAVDEIAREFPAMKKEFEAQNQVYLATGVVLDTYQIFSTQPIDGLSGLEGKKVAGAGYNMRYVEGIDGAVGVRGGLTDFYSMLQTGVADVGMLWPEAANTFKIAEVAPYMLKADLGAVNSKTVTANADFWKTLPQEVKDVINEVSIAYRDHIASVAMDRAATSAKAFVDKGGKIVELSAVERKTFADSMPNISQEWASNLDGKGSQGSEMLVAYMGKLQASGCSPSRDWAAELTQ